MSENSARAAYEEYKKQKFDSEQVDWNHLLPQEQNIWREVSEAVFGVLQDEGYMDG